MESYTVVLRNETQSKESPIAKSDSPGRTQSVQSYSSGQMRAQTALKALVAYDKFVAPFVEQAIQQQVSTIELRTGSKELQQRVEFGLGIAKQAGGIATSFLTGYAIGNLPGAIVGTLISGLTTALNYANKAQTLKLEQNLENVTLRGLNVRAGGYAPSYAGSRGRTQ